MLIEHSSEEDLEDMSGKSGNSEKSAGKGKNARKEKGKEADKEKGKEKGKEKNVEANKPKEAKGQEATDSKSAPVKASSPKRTKVTFRATNKAEMLSWLEGIPQF